MARGLKGIRSIEDFELKDQRVFIRVDFNVPMDGGKISDDFRIRQALPTIQYALDHGAKVILASHFGRPKGGGAEDREKYSLAPVAERLQDLSGWEVFLIDEPSRGDAPKNLLQNLRANQVLLLENVRFESGETQNSPDLARRWYGLTDIYINDAFGASHRAHASIDALPRMVPQRGLGFLLKREIEMLESLISKPDHPYGALLGGSKVSDKIGVIEKLLDFVDLFVIGGAMAYTFLKARGVDVGSSLVEREKIAFASEMVQRLETRGKAILLPVDHVISKSIEGEGGVRTTDGVEIPEGWMGFDIGPKTQALYCEKLKMCKTLFWNGPMGVFEDPRFSKGTFAVAEVLAHSGAKTIVGGGDSAAAAKSSGLFDRFTHVSTGGGASLEYLQGDMLPGIEALRQKERLV